MAQFKLKALKPMAILVGTALLFPAATWPQDEKYLIDSKSVVAGTDQDPTAYNVCFKSLTGGKDSKPGDTAFDGAAVACARPDWSLFHMNIQAAWSLLRNPGSKPGWKGEEPGTGVSIGQVDTGYTKHPAVIDRIDVKAATNTIDPSETGQDSQSKGFAYWFSNEEFLNPAFRDPSHGTKTASVAVGDPAKSTDPTRNGWVTGVVSAARFVPVRGTKGPGLLVVGPPQAARGLCYLTGGVIPPRGKSDDEALCFDRPKANWPKEWPYKEKRLAAPVDVITIARAAPTSENILKNTRLRDVLNFARDKGIIVVAASGDYEDFTVYPAEACAAISVGANVISGAPWNVRVSWWMKLLPFLRKLPGTPRAREDDLGNIDDCGQTSGLKIDISAPGAGVWRAATIAEEGVDNAPSPYNYGVGKGTSFATPAVAGIAAMWLQYQRVEIAQVYSDRRLIPYAFSYILRKGGGARDPRLVCDAANKRWGMKNDCDKVMAAWHPDNGPSLFGAGIVDAEGVLKAALPEKDKICGDLLSRNGGLDAKAIECPEGAPRSR